MKLLRYFLPLLTILLSNTSFSAIQAKEPNKYIFNVGQFHKINVDDNVNIIYRCVPDSSGYAIYRGTEEFSNAFILTNNKGCLRVQVNTEDVNNPDLPTLYLYSDFLTSVSNSSQFTLKVEKPAPCANFSARQVGNGTIIVDNIKATTVHAGIATGNGSVILSGECEKADFRMVGTGKIMADRLHSNMVKCGILGSGMIGCWPLQSLQVRGIGSTKIYYKGDPAISKTGGGKIYALPNAGAK